MRGDNKLGENAFRKDWVKDVKTFLEKLSNKIRIESAIIHGSAAKGLNGQWSDVDLLVVSDDFLNVPLLDRLSLLIELKIGKVEALGYTYEELKRMVDKGNPLALGALIEGKAIIESERVKKLRKKAEKMYFRKGRAWILRSP